ncbi:MAG TPA: heparinase II/III family protein [Acidobacteriaceae bacterium]
MQWMRRKFVLGQGLSRVARYRERSFGLTVFCCLGLALVSASSLHASASIVERGGYFTTATDLARLRAQASDPRLQSAYQQTKVDSDKMVAKWEKVFPADRPAPTTAELLAFGGKSVDRDAGYASVAIECALDPTPRNKRVLREMMIADLGWRQKLNYWNGMGIHDGEATTNFLESYDIGAQLGVFTTEDHAAIRNVMHQAGHFFEGWLLDNPFSRMYADKREQDYCLNFHVYSAASLSWIAMLYSDFPESASWLRQSEAALVEYLMNGYGEDGGYGEGSVHYWGLSTRALFNFLVLSKHLGVADYLAVPAIADRLRSTLHWRLDLTAPDGNAFAIGDSDRTSDAQAILYTGGELLSDREVLWGARMMFERAKGWELKGEGANPLFLAHLDMSLMGREPTHLSALYPLSGYATFRSGWDDQTNAMFFKFGTSFIGRREAQRGPVIAGHAHEDALEVELHYHGVAVVADGGRHGKYEDWATYGGFSKATVAHSTVGLGNEWGYDRLDGQYAKHQAEHGADFTYERTQQNIGRADTQLMAYGDLGQVAFSSARVRTYDAVEHQRSVVWFPGDSLTVLADHLESKEEQPYEWYLTPIGNPVGKDGELVFGDDVAKVQVLPVLPAGERATTISGATPNLPPYYVGLKGNAALQNADRWATFSLLVLAKKAKTTDFLNVLLPFSAEGNRWSVENVGASARRLVLKDKEVLVSGEAVGGPLTVNGQCGVVSRRNGQDQTYALIEGTGLARKGQGLISSTLKTPVWADRYPATLNALVSLPDKRASFDLRPWPLDDQLLLNPPRAVPGQEPTALLLISVSFHVDAKPARMVVLHSFSGDLKLQDPEFDKEAAWPRDWHAAVYKREALPFTYDAATGMVTIELEPGEHQVVWE